MVSVQSSVNILLVKKTNFQRNRHKMFSFEREDFFGLNIRKKYKKMEIIFEPFTNTKTKRL